MTGRAYLFGRKVVGIAAKLYEAQDLARRLYRECYDEMVEPYRKMLRSFVASGAGDELEACRRMLAALQARAEDTSVSQMLLMAATVDLVEPEGGTTR